MEPPRYPPYTPTIYQYRVQMPTSVPEPPRAVTTTNIPNILPDRRFYLATSLSVSFQIAFYLFLLRLLLQHGGRILSFVVRTCRGVIRRIQSKGRWFRLLLRLSIDTSQAWVVLLLWYTAQAIVSENAYGFRRWLLNTNHNHLAFLTDISTQILGSALLAMAEICLIEFAATGQYPIAASVPFQILWNIIHSITHSPSPHEEPRNESHSSPANATRSSAAPRYYSSTPRIAKRPSLQTAFAPESSPLEPISAPQHEPTSSPPNTPRHQYPVEDPSIWESSPTTTQDEPAKTSIASAIASDDGFRAYREAEGSSEFTQVGSGDTEEENKELVDSGLGDELPEDDETF